MGSRVSSQLRFQSENPLTVQKLTSIFIHPNLADGFIPGSALSALFLSTWDPASKHLKVELEPRGNGGKVCG